MQTFNNRRGLTATNKHLPFIWRAYYLHESPSPITALEIAHKTARQILEKNVFRAGR